MHGARWLHAFIDESGQRAMTARSSDHFVMAAVVIRDEDLQTARQGLAQLRAETGRHPGDPLQWKNLRGHSLRLRVAQALGGGQILTVSAVVVCKRHFPKGTIRMDEDSAYLYTLRYLLERLSWLARDNGRMFSYTLSHIIRFPTWKLRSYESILRTTGGCEIAWAWMDPHGGRINQHSRIELLQLADLTASAIAAAFEPDPFGNTERRYLRELAPRLYRRPPGKLTSYGLKIHPGNAQAKAAYPWLFGPTPDLS
jgi:hypothetical protein